MPLPLLPTVTDTPSPEEITPYPFGVKGYGVIASGEGVRARGTATATNRRFTLRGNLIFDFLSPLVVHLRCKDSEAKNGYGIGERGDLIY